MAAEIIMEQFEKELSEFNKCEEEIKQLAKIREELGCQLNENMIVKEELGLLKPSGEVLKQVGPLLLPQDPSTAKENIDKRLEYIERELKKVEDRMTVIESKKDGHGENLSELQQKYKIEKGKTE